MQMLNQVVVTPSAEKGAQFAGAIECFEDDAGIVSKPANNPEIDFDEIGQPARAKTIDGYMLVQKAQTLTGDKSMAFALVAMSVDKTHGVDQLRAHIADARDAAKTDASVRANLASHWSEALAQFD